MNLATIVESHPVDATALIDRFGSVTFGELRAQTARWRQALHRCGVGEGDRVALLCGNDRHFVGAYLGALGLGAIVAPLNPASPAPELSSELEVIEARVVVDSDMTAPANPAPADSAPSDSAPAEPAPAEPTPLDSAPAESAPPPILDRVPSDPAVLLFTSGTAGFPKAAVLTHGSLHANLVQIQNHPGRQALASDVGLGVLPLFHVFGLNVVLNLSLMVGSSLVLLERPDPAEALEAVARHGVTLLAGVPALFSAWCDALSGSSGGGAAGRASVAPGNRSRDGSPLSSVRMAISGAAPLSADIAGRFEEAFGIPLWEGYGLTEASPVVTSPVFEGRPVRSSVGVPLPGVELRLIDSNGADALAGDPGEVWVRGPNVFAGYWRDSEATMRVLDGQGWLHTGDVGVADEEGHLFLVERSKDLIIVSGFNVYPQEVEGVIAGVEGVAEVAVVGAPRRSGGEAVVAYVVRTPAEGTASKVAEGTASKVAEGTASKVAEGDVVGACRAALAGYKCPSAVFFVDSLPRAASGELLRRALCPDTVE